eukprot:1173541-Rhodomonas_salina.2
MSCCAFAVRSLALTSVAGAEDGGCSDVEPQRRLRTEVGTQRISPIVPDDAPGAAKSTTRNNIPVTC